MISGWCVCVAPTDKWFMCVCVAPTDKWVMCVCVWLPLISGWCVCVAPTDGSSCLLFNHHLGSFKCDHFSIQFSICTVAQLEFERCISLSLSLSFPSRFCPLLISLSLPLPSSLTPFSPFIFLLSSLLIYPVSLCLFCFFPYFFPLFSIFLHISPLFLFHASVVLFPLFLRLRCFSVPSSVSPDSLSSLCLPSLFLSSSMLLFCFLGLPIYPFSSLTVLYVPFPSYELVNKVSRPPVFIAS